MSALTEHFTPSRNAIFVQKLFSWKGARHEVLKSAIVWLTTLDVGLTFILSPLTISYLITSRIATLLLVWNEWRCYLCD